MVMLIRLMPIAKCKFFFLYSIAFGDPNLDQNFLFSDRGYASLFSALSRARISSLWSSIANGVSDKEQTGK